MRKISSFLLRISAEIKQIGANKQIRKLFEILNDLYIQAKTTLPDNPQQLFEKMFWEKMQNLTSTERHIYRSLIRGILRKAPSKKEPGKVIQLPETPALKTWFIAKIPPRYRDVLKQFAGVS